jgi:hypothetical protein
MYWSEEDGRNHTSQVADSGLFDYSMWSWCGQQSENSVEAVNAYLNTLAQFETDHPNMRFIYMTGHTDGGGATLARNNQMVRDYVAAHNKVLFDFADIEKPRPRRQLLPGHRRPLPLVRAVVHRPSGGLRGAGEHPRLRAHASAAVQAEGAGVLVDDGAAGGLARTGRAGGPTYLPVVSPVAYAGTNWQFVEKG